MKKIILLVVLFFGVLTASAQSFEEYKKQAQKEFSDYKEEQNRAFREYRDKINSQYASYMRGAWKSFEITEAIEIPELPEPPKPVVRDPEEKVSADPILFKEVVMPPAPRPEPPKPIIPIEALEEDVEQEEIVEEIIDTVPIPDPVMDDEPIVIPPAPKPEPGPTPDPVVDDEPELVPPTPDPVVDDEPIITPPAPKPEPIPDPVVDDEPKVIPPAPDPVVDDEPIVTPPAPKPEPKPTPDPYANKFTFNIYGTKCAVSLKDTHRFTLKGVDENSVADTWELLSTEKYNIVVAEALTLRDKLKLSDWGYFRLLEEMTTSFLGKNAVNEARVLQLFILVQSGYNVRIARTNDHIALLLPFDTTVYQFNYFTLDGTKYYIVDRSGKSQNYFIFDRKFPNEQILSITVPQSPAFDKNLTAPKSFSVDNIAVEVSLNQNLLDFYTDFPLNSSWIHYSSAAVSDELRNALFPKLKAAIAGKSEQEAVQTLLSFVQHAFDYKTDQEQFGYERPLFSDETFYYPYSDCEDRSILFAELVRELVGLDVVLLFYNNSPSEQHLATAVKFNSQIQGDYFNLSNEKFIICDPTYIGASIGMAMPMYKTSSATIYSF